MTRQSNNPLFLLFFVATILSIHSCSHNRWKGKDPQIDAIFYHPEERPYEKILASLAAKYEKDFHLSDREVIKAYPITAEEFDYFYETYNPQSEYGDYQADTLSFFVYVDKTIDSLAMNGNVECIYKVFNVYRFMDTKRNASLNGQWNISAGYQRLNDIIDTNRRVVRELFSLLGEHDLVKYYSQFHDVYSGS